MPLCDFDLVSRELNFWLLNLTLLNSRCLKHYSRSDAIVFSDASSVAAGAICVKYDQKVFHQMFSESKRCSSSTYGENKIRRPTGIGIRTNFVPIVH